MKLFIELLVFCVTCSLVYGNDEDLRAIDSIYNERPCIRSGGICTIAEDCPSEIQRGLCPNQMKSGVECCYGISRKETRCQKRGGECMKDCHVSLRSREATDCPENTNCCILV